jgi:hypothetical protein
MQHNYKGTYYKGSNVGLRKFKSRGGNITVYTKNKNWVLPSLIGFSMVMLIFFFYFNKKESNQRKRDNIEDTVELIQNVAKYNLETDLAKTQTPHTATNNSINYRNPAQVKMIQEEKLKAIALETKKRNDNMAKQTALNDNQYIDLNINMNETHGQFHKPPQPIDNNYQAILPIDKSREQQNQIMYNAQFNNAMKTHYTAYQNDQLLTPNNQYQKPYQTINSPFIHPQETIRPLAMQPKPFNNTLETGNKPDMFLENVPSNVFDNGFFNANQSYESPFLADANGITKYGNPYINNNNINKSGDPNLQVWSSPDYYYN